MTGTPRRAPLSPVYNVPKQRGSLPSAQLPISDVIMVEIYTVGISIATGTAIRSFAMPWAATLTDLRLDLTQGSTQSSSGVITVDLNEGSTPVSVLSTKITIDANESSSSTAATAHVISDSALAAGADMSIDVDTAGTGAAGPLILTLFVEHF